MQIIGGKVYLGNKAKQCWVMSTNFLFSKVCWPNAQQCFAFTHQANFPTHNLNFHWRWSGGIEFRLPFKIFSTLKDFKLKSWETVISHIFWGCFQIENISPLIHCLNFFLWWNWRKKFLCNPSFNFYLVFWKLIWNNPRRVLADFNKSKHVLISLSLTKKNVATVCHVAALSVSCTKDHNGAKIDAESHLNHYSCNKITKTWIQIYRQNWNGFFLKYKPSDHDLMNSNRF